MIFTALAGRCLAQSAMAVARPLQAGDLAESRHKLSWIVGRDTSQLQPAQINRAVVETVAENTVDGIIAPLFFLLLGGAPLAMAYKAVNTLDSMVGYKHEKYRAIGMVSARLDDVANFLPARLSWLLLSLPRCYAGKMAPGRCVRAGAIAISTAVLTAPGRKRPSPARWGSALAARTITSASALKSPG